MPGESSLAVVVDVVVVVDTGVAAAEVFAVTVPDWERTVLK